MASSGQIWVTNSLGGHLTNNSLSKSLRVQNEADWTFRQFCDIKEDPGKKRGDTVYFDKVLRLDTKGGTLTETATIPENKWKVTKGSVVLTEIGNSVPYTEKLETLAEFDPSDICSKTLKSDMLEVIDSLIAGQFDTADLTAVCTNTATTVFRTDGTALSTAQCNMSDKNVRDIVDIMEKYWIPKYADGNYRAIISVNSKRGLYDYLSAIAQYTKPEYMHNNEVGQYYNVRFVQDNAGSVLSDAVGSNSVWGEGFFFGQEAVMEAVAALEEIRMKVPTDYGRSKGVSWVGLMNWKKIWDYSDDDVNGQMKGIERIVKVTSA
jgi:N4-gp56 family major capsid protein